MFTIHSDVMNAAGNFTGEVKVIEVPQMNEWKQD